MYVISPDPFCVGSWDIIGPPGRRWKAEDRFTEFICHDRLGTFADFGGARIEENLLVTLDGHRILGKRRPRTIAEIGAFRRG